VLKSGIVRNRQRYVCKRCNYHFTLHHEKKRSGSVKPDLNRATTQEDIARAMGLSVSTVSRALKDHPDISLATRQAVRQLAQELAYEPNVLAQSLVTRTTHTIGVIIPSLETTFFASMLSGIQHIAARAGYRVVICLSDESQQTEISNVQGLMNNMIDGLLICHALHTTTFDHIRLHLRRGIPMIQFYRVSEEALLPRVLCEDEAGAFAVTEHLILAGCKRIALLLGPPTLSISRKRYQGYLAALHKYHICPDTELVTHVDFSTEAVARALEQWLELDSPIDGIFSIADKCGVELIQMLKARQIRVPDTICVAGFGNEYTGEIVEPQLTTFDVGTTRIGEVAARMIIERIMEPEREPEDVMIKGQLLVRGSTRRPTV
jgi:LacI family transcriptional regulator